MGRDDLNSAERRWRSRALFRRKRPPRRRMALLWLVIVAAGLWLVFDPVALPSAPATLIQLLPSR